MANLNKHVWEGWTVGDFIEDLTPTIALIMEGKAITKPFTSRDEVKIWCKDNQPYYKKYIPAVVMYFIKKYNL